MYLINWLDLQPQQAELDMLDKDIHEPIPDRQVRRKLVEITLQGYPWEERSDLVTGYHPSQTYKTDQWIALPVHDAQNIYPLIWRIAQVKKVEMAENPVQGNFQVLTLDVGERQIQLACGIDNAPFPASDLSQYTPQDLAWLVEWIENTYATALQSTLANLVSEGKLRGKLTGDIYTPEKPTSLDNKEASSLAHQPAFYQRMWKLITDFLQRLFRKKS